MLYTFAKSGKYTKSGNVVHNLHCNVQCKFVKQEFP